jgi:hypothetical protein
MSFKLPSLVVVLLAALEIAPLSSARIFLAGRNYPSGAYPVAAVVRDFNNDGIADIASANQNDKNVSVFLGNGEGTFGPANTFRVGAGAMEIASADLNSDGNADLVVTDGEARVYVVLGTGHGTFVRFSAIELHRNPLGIAIGDFNGDGILDLAVALSGTNRTVDGNVAILIGLGDGSFAPPVFYDLSRRIAVRLVTTDLNHDGKLDLAVAVQRGDGLAVLLGNGDGTFQPALFSQPGDSNDIAADDFNGDGNIDVVLANGFTVQVALGNGDGTFQSAIGYFTYGAAKTVATTDMNHDGVPDLVVGGDHTVVLLANGDGTFGSAALYGVGLSFARIGYFNHDRNADVVTGGNSVAIGVALGKGDGTLRAPIPYFVGGEGFDSADFDGDGHADVVSSGFSELLFVRGLGDGTFAAGVPIADIAPPHFLIATDLNNDGKPDLLVAPYNEFQIYTLLGNGDGTFQSKQPTAVSSDEVNLVVTDFNNDDQVDVALTGVLDDLLIILLGKGDGTFEPEITYQTGRIPESPVAADFNGDGNLDVAVCNAFGETVGIYLGNGDGTFASPLTISTFGPVYSAAGDVNEDGKVDLLIGGDDATKLYLGNGDGTFQSPQSIYSDYGPTKVADLDGDGHLDVAVSPGGARIVVLRGNGDSTFGSGDEFPIGTNFSGYFALSDLNGDAKPEAIVSNVYDSLTVLLNIARQP